MGLYSQKERMDGHILLLFFGVLALLLLSLWMSIPMGRYQEQRTQQKGGALLALRTRTENIKNWQNKCKWTNVAMALRAIRLMKGKRRLMYERNGLWYVVSGDDLEVRPDPTGDVVIRFLPNCPPITLEADPTNDDIVTSSASFPAPESVSVAFPPSTVTLDGWDHWPDSALADHAFSNIERFGTLADAQRGADPCSTNKSDPVTYIVGGSRIDPTYYVVHVSPDNAVIIRSSAGTSVYRRKCGVET